jgi:uncharacterized protein
MNDLQLPLLHLFQRLRQRGMALTIEQYELLRQSLDKGFGLDWNSLERICRLLWVKPSLNYDEAIFRQEFDDFRRVHQEEFMELGCSSIPMPPVRSNTLLILPPRNFSQSSSKGDSPPPKSLSEKTTGEDGLGAIDLPASSQPLRKNRQFELDRSPISLEQVLQIWKRLHRPVAEPRYMELNLEATIQSVNREGFLAELVMKPLMQKSADLLLLVDESSGMTPYQPIWQPWVQAVTEQRIAPAQIYRFSCGVSDVVYPWYEPLQLVAVDFLLGEMNSRRSVVILLSDGGAATQSKDPQKIKSMQNLLKKFSMAAREILWLNPVPKKLWANSSAATIAKWLEFSLEIEGVMLPFDLSEWKQFSPCSTPTSFKPKATGCKGVLK